MEVGQFIVIMDDSRETVLSPYRTRREAETYAKQAKRDYPKNLVAVVRVIGIASVEVKVDFGEIPEAGA